MAKRKKTAPAKKRTKVKPRSKQPGFLTYGDVVFDKQDGRLCFVLGTQDGLTWVQKPITDGNGKQIWGDQVMALHAQQALQMHVKGHKYTPNEREVN